MAPTKGVITSENKLPTTGIMSKVGSKTRSQGVTLKKDLPKRKAEESPLKRVTVKRSALNEVTNFADARENGPELVKAKMSTTAVKKTFGLQSMKVLPKEINAVPRVSSRVPLVERNSNNIAQPPLAKLGPQKSVKAKPPVAPKPVKKEVTELKVTNQTLDKRASLVPAPAKTVRKVPRPDQVLSSVQYPAVNAPAAGVQIRRSLRTAAKKSLDLEKSTESSLLEDGTKTNELKPKVVDPVVQATIKALPTGVSDFDKEQLHDVFSVAEYAMDIFEYLKGREKDFMITDYMPSQKHLSVHMRALLVDWLVEVQENFELNHESLYMGIKLVDLYLTKHVIVKTDLQLLGITGLFIASKYDERVPPTLDDFVYVCDNLYKTEDILKMEWKILKTIDYQLGIPISYRFLRRYSRCGKHDMEQLTLARYILESDLMNYDTCRYSDSKMAAAVLFLALKMKGKSWTKNLEFYSGYKVDDFKSLVLKVNAFLHKPKNDTKVVRNKYQHKLFFEVAKIPLIPNDKLTF